MATPNDRLDNLINDLSRPIYNYRMASPVVLNPQGYEKASQRKSAQTRYDNARKEIHDIVAEYIATCAFS